MLADAIKTVTESHAGTCDVHHVGTPSATVIIVRAESGMLDYLVLADSILVLHYADDRNDVICDNREAEVARPYRPAMTSTTHGTPEHAEGRRSFMNVIREHRNTPGGFGSHHPTQQLRTKPSLATAQSMSLRASHF